MSKDDEDMYAIALGEHYVQSSVPSTASISAPILGSSTNKKADSSSNKVDHSALFRELLIGSRSQIDKLKSENEQLKTNLKNAIDSGGVVICPNCTHHFKDRQCPMRPRAMKKMRARNMVELEFSTQEDLQTWLYLNQLETNNDGMPTVMNVKKAFQGLDCSLKAVGSLLPDLVEKKKEVRKAPDLEKVNREKHLETRNPRTSEKTDRKKSSDKRRDRKEFSERLGERKTCSAKCDNKSNSRERIGDNHRQIIEKNKSQSERSRKSCSPITITLRTRSLEGEKRKENENHRRDESIESKMNKDNLHKPELSKRKLSPAQEDVRERKVPRQTIARRIQFPEKNKEYSCKSLETLDPLLEELAVKETTILSIDKSSSHTANPLRKPIVWNDSKLGENEFVEPKITGPKSTFEFKVKVVEKKKKEISLNNNNVSQKTTTCINSESTSKYKFVPTSKKIKPEVPKKMEDEKVDSSIFTTSCKTQETKSASVLFANDDRLLETSKVTDWKLYSVKKTQAVLEHASKHKNERKNNPVIWSGKTIIVTVEEQNCKMKSASISESVIPYPESTEIKICDSTYDEKIEQQRIADSMKRFGFSKEGIAVILKRQAENKKNSTVKNLQDGSTVTENYGSIRHMSDSSSFISSTSVPLKSSDPLVVNDEKVTSISEQPKDSSSPVTKTVEFNIPGDYNEENYEEDGDVFSEFFPNLATVKTREALETVNVESSGRPFSTASFGSMVDREEDELTRLVREDSAAPPGGDDCLMDLEEVDYEETITEKIDDVEEEKSNHQKDNSNDNSDWKDFCLEDLDEDLDNTERDRKISEVEQSDDDGGEEDEEMEWLETAVQENVQDDSESIHGSPEPKHSESDLFTIGNAADEELPKPQRSESIGIDMKNDFRLSDDEDVISPMTSTPRQETECPDDISEPPDDDKDDFNQPNKDDSFVDELDWNYGTDMEEEEEQNEVEETEETKVETAEHPETEDRSEVGVETGMLEEGEISENEDVKSEDSRKEKHKPIRERIQYIDEGRQVQGAGHDEKRRSKHRGEDKERRRRSSSRRRGSEENRHRNYKRDNKPDTYCSLLKRRNT